MKLYFTLWNIVLQDGNFEELEVGKNFTDCSFELYNLTNIKKLSNNSNASINHIEDNLHNITGNVYRIKDGSIFIDVGGIFINIENKIEYNINKIGIYSFDAYLTNDIWNFVGQDQKYFEKYSDELEISGTITSIKIDRSKYIKLKEKKFSKDGVKPMFDISIYKSSYWDDEDKYADGAFDYLVELEIDSKKYIRRKFIYGLKNLINMKVNYLFSSPMQAQYYYNFS